jgi:RNA polymerase sigma-70 factor (ECF subfamily)
VNTSHNAQLVEQCLAGDMLAIERLVGDYKHAIYRLALSILDDPAEADEAVQDTFVAAFDALDSYRGDSSFRTWLYAIALNHCRMRLRRRGAHERMLKAWHVLFHLKGEADPHPEMVAIRNEADSAVWQAIAALDEKQRLPLLLRYYHDLPIAEIAELLRTSERTVYARLHDAHERLKAALNGNVDWK